MPLDFGKADWNSFNANDDPESLIGIETGPETKLRSTLGEAMKVQPDAQARINRLSRESGIPQFAVEPAPDEVEFQLKLDSVDWDAMSKRSPVTSAYLTDYNNAAIAHDDINVMESLESALTSVKQYGTDISLSFEKGQRIVESSDIGLKRMYAALNAGEPVTDDQITRLKELETSLSKEIGDYGFLPGAPMAASEQLPILWEIIQSGVGGAAGGAAVGAAVGAAAGAITGPGAVATGTAGAFLGAKWGGRLGVAKAAFDLEAGMAFNEFASLKDEAGVTVSPQIAGYGAATVGALNAALESLSFAALGRTVTPTMRLLMRNKVKQALLTESGREMALRIGGTYATAVAAESITEGLQELTNVIGAEFVKLADKDAFTDQNVSDVLDNVFSIDTLERVGEAAKKGAQASLILSTPGTVSSVVIEQRQKTRITEDEQQQIDAINTAASESKLKIRDPDALKQFLNQADGDKNTNVFIDGAQASLYLGSKDRATIDADPALSMLRDQVAEASRLQTDINIPVADFAASFTGTEHFDALRPHMTLSEDTVSPFRQEQVQSETQQYVQSLMAEAQGNVSQYVEAQEIFESVKAQLVDTGTVTPQNAGVMAQVVPAWATVFAQKNGISVQEAYQKAGLTIEGPQTGRLAELTDVLEQDPDLATIAEFNRQPDDFQFENFEQREAAVTSLVNRDLADEQFTGAQLPTGSGTVMITPSAKQDGMWQVTQFDDQGQPLSDNGIQTKEEALRDFYAEGRPELIETAAPLRQEAAQQDNLFVAHNISVAGLRHAAELGGLAAPSIAVGRTDVGFGDFGEITLMADPSLLESPRVRTFDADIYTPRQPRAVYSLNSKMFRNFTGSLAPEELGLSAPDLDTASEGPDALLRSDAARYKFLEEQGKLPKIKAAKVDAVIKQGAKLEGDRWVLRDDPKFTKLVEKHYRKMLEQVQTADPTRAERYEGFWFESDGSVQYSKVSDMAAEVDRFRNSGGQDLAQFKSDLRDKFKQKKLAADYEKWVTDHYNSMVEGKKIFKGFTDAGNKKFIPYTLDNVVKEITSGLQAGEGTFYGAGTVRAAYANEMKTIKQVQARRDQIVPADQVEKMKDESNAVLQEALEKLKPFYKFDADGWGYADDAGSAIAEGRKGIREAFKASPEVDKIIGDLTEYLSALPTSYFEAKAQRSVQFSEFDTAIVPKNIPKEALQILKDAGLKIKRYDPAVEGSRDQVVAQQQKLLFQRTPASPDARGYFDPANTVIRLTEASDLSTFLHEFAHFMYEMERSTGSDTAKSIGSWFKRNADAVAKEASGNEKDTTVTAEDVISFIDNDTTGDTVKDRALYRAVHEQFARGFETYLMEGKAPSLELRNAFRTFARWLTQVYRAVKGNLKVNLDAEMKQVFDRMLATEDQISAAEARARYAPMFTDALMAGMTEEEFASYQKQQNKTKDKQTETLRDKIIKELTRKQEKWWKDERKDLIEEELDSLKTEQVYTAQRVLREGRRAGVSAADIDQLKADIKTQEADIKGMMSDVKTLGKSPKLRGQIALWGGLDRGAFAAEGIDHAEFKTRSGVFGKPLFPKDGGMSADDLAEKLNEIDYQGGNLSANDAVDIVGDLTIGDSFVDPTVDVQIESLERSIANVESAIEGNKSAIEDAELQSNMATIKLDRAAVKDMVGEDQVNKLGRKNRVIPPALRGMTVPGGEGVHPDEAAGFFGYNSGHEMLLDLITAPKMSDLAEQNAEQRMREIHGDIMNDGTIEREADEAVQNEERGKLILMELKALSKNSNIPAFDRRTVKTLAEDRIGKLSFREIFPGKYRKAEIAAAQESARMLAEGNREGAAVAKSRQVLNYYLGMAATEAKNDTMKIVDRMARYNKKRVREAMQKADGGYWEQLTKILNRFEFRKSASLADVESLNTWVAERITEDGDALVLSPRVLDETYVTHWKNVPFADLKGISDSVTNIEHVARYANKITRLQQEMDFKALVSKWVDHMDQQKSVFKPQRTDVVEGRNGTKWGKWAMAQMTKIPYLASWLDGGERVGMSHDILVQPFTNAYNEEAVLWKEIGAPVMRLIQGRSKAERKRHMQKIFIPEIKDANNDGHLFMHQIIAVALNTGNAGNLRKMLLGEGWANPENDAEITFNNPQLQAVLKHMTRSDWAMVQEIWSQMEKLYPQLAEVHRRTTGLAPPQVEAVPFEVVVGGETVEMKGGYYPVKYDPNRSHRAAQNEDRLNAETESMFGGVGIQASVNASATNERTGYYGPIRLSLDVVPSHFQETIHYITHHDAVREANRLIKNKAVAETIRAKLGPYEYNQLKPWLNDIAKDGREAPTRMFWDDMLGKLRFGITLGAMGFKASTGIMQLFGLSNSMAELGTGNVLQAMRTVVGSPATMKGAWDFAVENSKVMNHRVNTMDREIKNAMQRIEGKQGILAAAQEASMKHIALIQTYLVDLPTWHAAYIKGMKDWGDEGRAFEYADWVIENVQGSGATKDLAGIMRNQNEAARQFTMFMTFFSALWNIQRDLKRGAQSGLYSKTNVAAKMMLLFTLPVFVEMLMRGELGGDDEPEEQLQGYLTKLALYPVTSVPFVRDIASGVVGEYGYNLSPLAQILEQGTRTIPEIATRTFTDEEITKGQIKGATKFIGAAAGVPGTGQAWATGEHLYDVMVDGEDLTLREFIFGPERK